MDVEAFNTFELLLILSFFNISKSGCAIFEKPFTWKSLLCPGTLLSWPTFDGTLVTRSVTALMLDVPIPYPVIVRPKKLICLWNNLLFFLLWFWYRFLLIFETLYVNDQHVNRSDLNTLAHRLNKGMQIYLLRQSNSFPSIFEILMAHWKDQMGLLSIRTSSTV